MLGRVVPVVGGPVFGILIGACVAVARKPGPALKPGIRFASRTILQAAIVLLGATLQLNELWRTGLGSLPVMLGSAVVTLTAAFVLGKLLGIDRDVRRLIGIGTTICGGSAIAALSRVIDVTDTDVAYAISTVFLFNVAAVLTFPWIGRALHLSQHAFGLWAGTAVNDTSSVVAAGYTFGFAAGTYAVIVKLTRTLLIVPLVAFYAGKRVWQARGAQERVPWREIVPWFILYFVLAAIANTFAHLPPDVRAVIAQVAGFSIVVALAGVGLSVDARAIRAAGARPLLLGLLLWATIAVSSLALARVFRVA